MYVCVYIYTAEIDPDPVFLISTFSTTPPIPADMLHPSPLAVDILFHRLQQSHFVPEPALLNALTALQSALAHRPSDSTSAAHQAFLRKQLEALQALQARHPHLDLGEEARRLRARLLD